MAQAPRTDHHQTKTTPAQESEGTMLWNDGGNPGPGNSEPVISGVSVGEARRDKEIVDAGVQIEGKPSETDGWMSSFAIRTLMS